jgi:hypothetical protein
MREEKDAMTDSRLKSPRSLLAHVRALYTIFGWKMPAATLGGLGLLAMVVSIRLLGRPIGWFEWTTLATAPVLLLLVGVSSLRERWLSLAPLAGFQPRLARPRPWLRWLLALGLLALGSFLLVGGCTQPFRNEKQRLMTLFLGGFCLLGVLALVRLSAMARRHVLVREGLALRNRHGWSLIPWDRMESIAVGTYYENVVASIRLSHLLTPLPTSWRETRSAEQRRHWLERQLRGFQTARNWVGADVLIWNWTCGLPPGLFAQQVEEALADAEARQRLPAFAEATGMPSPLCELETREP